MTVGELKKELEKHPDLMDVFMAERKTEFSFGLVNSVYKKEIEYKGETDIYPFSTSDCVIIDEE